MHLFLFPLILLAQNTTDWTVDLKSDVYNINWFQQANDGTLVIGGSKSTMGLDHKTGEILWKNDQLKAVSSESIVHVDPLPFMMLETATMGGKKNIVMIETHSGEVITNSQNEDFTLMNYNLFTDEGFILFELKENDQYVLSLYDIAKNETQWKLPIDKAKKGLKGLLKGQTSFLSKVPYILDGSAIVNYKKKVMVLDITSGDMTWSKEYDKKIDELFVIENEIFISQGKEVVVLAVGSGEQSNSNIKLKDDLTGYQDYEDGFYLYNQKGFNPFNQESKSVMWDKPDKIKQTHELYLTKNGYVSINLGEDNRVEDQGSVALVDKNGKKIWQKSFDGSPIYVFPTVKGVFFISDKHSNVFSYSDGKTLIKKGIKITDKFAVAFDAENQEVVIYSDKKLTLFNVETGKPKVLAEDIDLKKYDSEKDYLNLEVRPDGYFLYSSNNTVFINHTGKVKFNNYYKPVKSSGLLAAALSVANSATGLNMEESYGDFQQIQGLMGGVVVSGEKTSSSRKSTTSVASSYVGDETVFDVSITRFNATSETKDFLYVFTKLDDKNQLLKINKDTGDVEKKFILKDKDPTYLVDEFDQRLYFLEKSSINSLPLN